MTLDTMTIGRNQAQTATVERLFNAFLRETGVFDPTVPKDSDAHLADIPASIVKEWGREGTPMRIVLPLTKVDVIGSVTYVSALGHHRYGSAFWIVQKNAKTCTLVQQAKELAEPLLQELAESASLPLHTSELVARLQNQMENSIQKTITYVGHGIRDGRSFFDLEGAERFITAEQSLVFGHPFHPTPKSSQGFSEQDMARYAPEMGASFALHYFACAPELVKESFLNEKSCDEGWISSEVSERARQILEPAQLHYRLMPCHPWQAEHVKTWEVTQDLIQRGWLVDLGQLGDEVYPTSSVRTVWDPKHSFFFKLPLNVRITNFIRVNPLDQLERTMDASRVVSFLSKRLPFANFTILHEAGYRSVAPLHVSPEEREKLTESFAVIWRENPVMLPIEKDVPIVVAATLEQPPHSAEPPIMAAIRLAGSHHPELTHQECLEKWLRQYLEISLVPLLWLFVKHGVSMEAHVQNSMIALQDGWPVHFYVRDLEGVSIGRERAFEQEMFDNCLTENSPVLYTEEDAWNRFKYYVVVNHVGHLIHAMAYYGSIPEETLWRQVAEVIRTTDFYQSGKVILDDLLESEGLPAKANLISSFQQRGERPLYVTIPNPLEHSRGKA
ncbi:MAG: siderophore synthetase [Brevibacillus sp.]|nr:siderophore synthetase [Brevibacillus sp.]